MTLPTHLQFERSIGFRTVGAEIRSRARLDRAVHKVAVTFLVVLGLELLALAFAGGVHYASVQLA
jgi:hypothetical protein